LTTATSSTSTTAAKMASSAGRTSRVTADCRNSMTRPLPVDAHGGRGNAAVRDALMAAISPRACASDTPAASRPINRR
jgi:hypothetical protein